MAVLRHSSGRGGLSRGWPSRRQGAVYSFLCFLEFHGPPQTAIGQQNLGHVLPPISRGPEPSRPDHQSGFLNQENGW